MSKKTIHTLGVCQYINYTHEDKDALGGRATT